MFGSGEHQMRSLSQELVGLVTNLANLILDGIKGLELRSSQCQLVLGGAFAPEGEGERGEGRGPQQAPNLRPVEPPRNPLEAPIQTSDEEDNQDEDDGIQIEVEEREARPGPSSAPPAPLPLPPKAGPIPGPSTSPPQAHDRLAATAGGNTQKRTAEDPGPPPVRGAAVPLAPEAPPAAKRARLSASPGRHAPTAQNQPTMDPLAGAGGDEGGFDVTAALEAAGAVGPSGAVQLPESDAPPFLQEPIADLAVGIYDVLGVYVRRVEEGIERHVAPFRNRAEEAERRAEGLERSLAEAREEIRRLSAEVVRLGGRKATTAIALEAGAGSAGGVSGRGGEGGRPGPSGSAVDPLEGALGRGTRSPDLGLGLGLGPHGQSSPMAVLNFGDDAGDLEGLPDALQMMLEQQGGGPVEGQCQGEGTTGTAPASLFKQRTSSRRRSAQAQLPSPFQFGSGLNQQH